MRISSLIVSLLLSPHSAKAATSPAWVESNWGLKDLQAELSWKKIDDKKSVVVALVDTGADLQHPDLKDNFWTNLGEVGLDRHGNDKSNNGIDDDSNGYVDDIHGWNFVDDTNDLTDSNGHGTHIAGIIGAHGHALGKGSYGVAPHTKMMILKYYDAAGRPENNLKNSIRALEYAILMKAQIINYSGGGFGRNLQEEQAVKKAQAAHILLVAAAGNERSNIDRIGFFPASYGLTNVLTVTAYNSDHRILATSNFGAKSVDLAAPGQDIFSTLPGGLYGRMSGTSQATAFVTGAAALMLSQSSKNLSPETLIRQMASTASPVPAFIGKTKSNAKINLPNALRAALNEE